MCSLAGLLAAGCASTEQNKASESSNTAKFGDTEASILEHEDVKGKESVAFKQPIGKVREAGLRALTFVGCEIKQNRPLYLSGRRPNKFGVFVGSGGETVEIFLAPMEGGARVWVDTDMSFVGIAGQQGWNDQVLAEMQRILGGPQTTPPQTETKP